MVATTSPSGDLLPSWRPGATRDAVVDFLDAVLDIPVEERFACFDNDGTLWVERPDYVQYDFFVESLRSRHDVHELRERPELAAVLDGDASAMVEIGLEPIAAALAGLFDGLRPEEFAALVRRFLDEARHPELDRPYTATTYQPMLELLDELRRREVTISLVTGGGTEFVRAISRSVYGVPPELVVGTLIGYDFTREDDGRPGLRRTTDRMGRANEGAAKVANIQSQIGRRPILAAGNSGGDREMLEWACSSDGPCLPLLIDHDDADREYRYVGRAQTFTEDEPITEVGRRLGWTVVSMANDWSTVFPA